MGSGCATQTDVDFVWQDVQSMVIRDMVSKDNLRPDGRGLIDSRPASYQVTSLGMGSNSHDDHPVCTALAPVEQQVNHPSVPRGCLRGNNAG